MTEEGQGVFSAKATSTLKEALINFKVFASIAVSSLSSIGNKALMANIVQLEQAIAETSTQLATERTALARDIRTLMTLEGWASTKKALKELHAAKERLDKFVYENDPEGRVIIYTGADNSKLKKLVKESVEINAQEKPL